MGLICAGACWLAWELLRVPDKPGAAAQSLMVTNKSVAAPLGKKAFSVRTASTNQARLPATNAVRAPEITRTSAVPVTPPPQNVPAIPDVDPNKYPRPVRDLFEAQVALARHAICPGPIDGVAGSQTRAALRAFQRSADLHETGELDPATRVALSLDSAPLKTRILSAEDFARLQPLSRSWLGKSQQSRLEYESIGELLAEEGRCSVKFLQRLNESVLWDQLQAGSTVVLPAIDPPVFETKATYIVIHLTDRTLWLLDEQDRLLAHFPCSIAKRVDKRPTGKLSVEVIIPNPDYTFDPKMFSESPEARTISRKLVLPPGPNNPVGVAWIGLNRPGYGIHGTPGPEQVGRAESHGCFRLANWNAALLLKLVWVGMPVLIE